MTPREQQLFDCLREMREACCAAMRVVADLDMAHSIGMDAETRQQRFIDELHAVGVKDGFGVRADRLIQELLVEAPHA